MEKDKAKASTEREKLIINETLSGVWEVSDLAAAPVLLPDSSAVNVEEDDYTCGEDEGYLPGEEHNGDYDISNHMLDASDYPYVEKLQSGLSAEEDFDPKLLGIGVNAELYYVSKSLKSGAVAARLRRRGELRMASAISAARSEIAKIRTGCYLYNSISLTVGIYDFEYCLSMMKRWIQWHSHWVYGTCVDFAPDVHYPLRSNPPNQQSSGYSGKITEEVTPPSGIPNVYDTDCRSLSSWDGKSSSEEEIFTPRDSDGDGEIDPL